jgi:hypothetical protein
MTFKDDRYNAVALSTSLIFGTLLSAADKMGIKPMLLGRQASKILAPILNLLAKQLHVNGTPSNLKELVKDIENITKSFSSTLGMEIEVNFSGNSYTHKLTNCPYLEMAKFGKSIGYKTCPLCGQMIILMGAFSALDSVEVLDSKVENNENVCTVKILLEQK